MTEQERERLGLPERCECGGRMLYEMEFGRIWSICDRCTPSTAFALDNLGRVVPVRPDAVVEAKE